MQVFRPIGVLNRCTELWHSNVKYKFIFHKASSPPSASSLLKLPTVFGIGRLFSLRVSSHSHEILRELLPEIYRLLNFARVFITAHCRVYVLAPTALATFSTPEAALLLVSTKNRDERRGRDSWCSPKGARPLGTRMPWQQTLKMVSIAASQTRKNTSETPKVVFLLKMKTVKLS